MATAPYRSETPLARYPLRTPWPRIRALIAREMVVVLVIAWVVRRVILWVRLARHDDSPPPYLFLLLLTLAPLGAGIAWLARARRLVVRRGTAIEVYADRIELVVPGRPARAAPVASIDVVVASVSSIEERVIGRRRVRVPMSRPTNLRIDGLGVGFEVSAETFATPWHAERLRSDVARVREGKKPLDHDHPDPAAIAEIVEQALAAPPAGQRDELDDRIDEELARLPDRRGE